jgi:hypothetical protein
MLNKICTWTAKSAPPSRSARRGTAYPPCTVTALWLKFQDRDRMLRRVTQPPHIAGPLCTIYHVLTSQQQNNEYKNRFGIH